MNRVLMILVCLGCAAHVVHATPSALSRYPANLGWLFGLGGRRAAEESKEPKQPVAPCETEECQLFGRIIKQSMDDSVDPCDDFYEYACGNWANNNEVPEGMRSWDLWHMVQKKITDAVLEIFTAEPKPDDILATKLGKKWYRICMDTEKIEEAGLHPLLTTMDRIGGWPLIMEPDEWDERAYHWQKVDDYYTRLRAQSAFYDLDVVDPYGEGSIIVVSTPHLPARSYRLYAGDDGDDGDDSNENESEEKSEAPGSEEETHPEHDEKNEENSSKLATRRKKVSKHKVAVKRDHTKVKSSKRSGGSKRHHVRHPSKRIKRGAKSHTKHQVTSERRGKKGKVSHSRNIAHHHLTKQTRVSKHKKVEDPKPEDVPEETEDKTEEENESKNKNEDDKDDKSEDEGEDEGEDEEEDEDEDEDEDENDGDGDSSEESAEMKREMYKQYITNVAKLFAEARGSEVPEEKLEKDVEDLVAFQLKIIELVINDSGYENMTLGELQELYDSYEPKSRGKVNWLRKLRRQFNEAEVEIEGDEPAIVACIHFMKGLATLLDETPSETIVNYIHWNFLSLLLMAGPKSTRDLYLGWENLGEPEEMDREKQCAREVEMHDIAAYEFVKKYFKDDLKKLALDMIDDIQKEVEYQIKESEWLDEDTKDFIFDKLVNLKRLVGYPDWYKNATIVKRYFRGLVIGTSYYENVLSYFRYAKWKELRAYIESEEVETWDISPMTLNAFFMPTENTIAITAADFQSPFFALSRPESINYGIIGFVMAHEVNHGFDDQGHLYNKNGKVMEWLSAMAAAYNERAKCFVDQFNGYSVLRSKNYTIEDYGNQTSGENIADTMGLQSVYRAYQRRQRECGKVEPPLPGLEKYTNEQLFFLSFANLWCEAVEDPEDTLAQARFDVHSTGRLRVIGSVSNSEDFAKAFHCPVGSPMNPEKKCNIWK